MNKEDALRILGGYIGNMEIFKGLLDQLLQLTVSDWEQYCDLEHSETKFSSRDLVQAHYEKRICADVAINILDHLGATLETMRKVLQIANE